MEKFLSDLVSYTIGFCFGWWACKNHFRRAAALDKSEGGV